MSRSTFTFAVLALFCLTTSLCASNHGKVSVNVTNTTYLNNAVESQDQEFVEFNYQNVEWNGEAANYETEWAVEEDGVGEFMLTDNQGDSVVLDAFANDVKDNLAGILNTVTASPAGGKTNVASNVANSIIASQQNTKTVVNNNGNSNSNNNVAVVAAPVVATEAVKAVEAVEAHEAVEAVKTTESVEAVKTTESVEAVEAHEAVEAVEAHEAVEAVKATESVEAVKAQSPLPTTVDNVQAVPVEAVPAVVSTTHTSSTSSSTSSTSSNSSNNANGNNAAAKPVVATQNAENATQQQ